MIPIWATSLAPGHIKEELAFGTQSIWNNGEKFMVPDYGFEQVPESSQKTAQSGKIKGEETG